MRIPGINLAPLLLAALLPACSQENAPSEAISKAADSVVKTVDGTAPAKLAQGEFAPRDECGDIPGAAAFRSQLADAVRTRDADKLVALTAPDVKLDFGGGNGTAELRARLADQDLDLWGELETVLGLGCAPGEAGGVTLPWHFAQDYGARDPMMTMIVLGEDVPAFAAADRSAQPVARLSWDAVELAGGLKPSAPVQQVRLADDRTVFVASDKLRSVIDYRLSATSRDGKWSVISLVAGD